MKIVDISWPITPQMTTYKNKKDVSLVQVKNFDEHGVRETAIHCGSHTGTHIDAPSHFLPDGDHVEKISLNRCIGNCVVIDCTAVAECITKEVLVSYTDVLKSNPIVLFKTRNSFVSDTALFDSSFIYLDASGAEFLVSCGVTTVGIDYLGIERNQPDHKTHTVLMRADILIVEGLRLKDVEPGNYTFICLPLRVVGLEASLARAVLVSPNHFD